MQSLHLRVIEERFVVALFVHRGPNFASHSCFVYPSVMAASHSAALSFAHSVSRKLPAFRPHPTSPRCTRSDRLLCAPRPSDSVTSCPPVRVLGIVTLERRAASFSAFSSRVGLYLMFCNFHFECAMSKTIDSDKNDTIHTANFSKSELRPFKAMVNDTVPHIECFITRRMHCSSLESALSRLARRPASSCSTE